MNHADFTETALRYECRECDFTTGSLRSAAKHEQENDGHSTDVAGD